MKKQTLEFIWQSLDADGKRELADKSRSSYHSMAVMISRGRMGQDKQFVVASALIELDLASGSVESVQKKLFPVARKKAA